MAAPYRRVGRIVKPHGTHGEVAIALERGLDGSILRDLEVWIVPPVGVPRPRRVVSQREGARGPLVYLQDIDDAAGAHSLTGRWLLASGISLPEPGADEADLLGYLVVDAVRGDLGRVSDIIHTGANDVLVVDGGRYGEVLLPVIDDVMGRVDHAERVIEVRLLEGLIQEDGA